ncbi:MAG: lipoprotein-releasing system transmembrane subunit LolC, partial [Betaproteobacteria bacterium]|nr:lipoprotein-releasing system transmembrane subunit LolC [Betaproteobacteria bacterium]
MPFELEVGLRYIMSGRRSRSTRFISFISVMATMGIALGVAALIIVLSVMNGFQKEVRDRMLSVIPHIEVFSADGSALGDWQAVAQAARIHPEVIGASPFIATQVLVSRGETMRGAIVRGISPAEEATVTTLGAQLKDTAFAALQPGQWNIVLGVELARALGVGVGDKVTVVAPSGQVTPA